MCEVVKKSMCTAVWYSARPTASRGQASRLPMGATATLWIKVPITIDLLLPNRVKVVLDLLYLVVLFFSLVSASETVRRFLLVCCCCPRSHSSYARHYHRLGLGVLTPFLLVDLRRKLLLCTPFCLPRWHCRNGCPSL